MTKEVRCIVGIKLFLFCCSVFLIRCVDQPAPQSLQTPKSIQSPRQLLSLGDSYTIGESVVEGQRWPNQLVQRLKTEGILFAPPTIVAKTGWTTDELLEGITRTTLRENYDFVSLMIGVNNQYRGRSIENFRAEFEQLLALALDKVSGQPHRVFVLSIPDWGVTPFAQERDSAQIATEIDAFNAAIATICAAKKVTYIDVTSISRSADSSQFLAPDGLHPSGEMYGLWVDAIMPFFKKHAE